MLHVCYIHYPYMLHMCILHRVSQLFRHQQSHASRIHARCMFLAARSTEYAVTLLDKCAYVDYFEALCVASAIGRCCTCIQVHAQLID